MTPLERYNKVVSLTNKLRAVANDLDLEADRMESAVEHELGLYHHDRGPGFASWTMKGLPLWYSTPEEVLEAWQKWNTETTEAGKHVGSGI